MYPVLRILWGGFKARRQSSLALFDTHVSQHICMPWDIDLWRELNNGRTLTLYDLGRIPLAIRTGMIRHLAKNKWGLTVAAANVRYRRRIVMFEKFEMRSRAIGWDDKFFYMEQSIWKQDGECANHAVYRTAIISKAGMVRAPVVMQSFAPDLAPPTLPNWVQDWVAAEENRPWPPMQESLRPQLSAVNS
ncbi:MAG: acyl-CoA thioesterase [Cognatishimia sp.]